MTKVSEGALSGQRMVKIFAGADYENQRFCRGLGQNRHMQIRLGRISGLSSLVVEVLAALALGLVVYYSVGKFSAGEFAAFIGALLMIISPMKILTNLNEDLNVGLEAAKSVFRLIDAAPQIDEGRKVIQRSKGEIKLR